MAVIIKTTEREGSRILPIPSSLLGANPLRTIKQMALRMGWELNASAREVTIKYPSGKSATYHIDTEKTLSLDEYDD